MSMSQGAFLYVPDFLPADISSKLAAAAASPWVNRNYLPGHKQGGSVSRHTIDRLAPFIADLYRSPALIGWLERVCGEPLQMSPLDDPHAYALYFYTRPGDHIGWHYDTSYYAGRRYTLLLGVLDESSCRLDYELHTREAGVAVVQGSIKIPPGGLVFFDPTMRPWRRMMSNMKDALKYFGFRQVFRRTKNHRRNSRGTGGA